MRRKRERGTYDAETINAILDEALVCHVGFVADGAPVVIPTIHARLGDQLVLHGSPANRMLRTLKAGGDVCVCVTLIDGLVLARSALHHSMNYRSVVLFGKAEEVTDLATKREALRAVIEHIVAGRWSSVRQPTDEELRQTLVLAMPIDEASAKVRTGPPIDDAADLALEVEAGVVPLQLVAGELVAHVPDER